MADDDLHRGFSGLRPASAGASLTVRCRDSLPVDRGSMQDTNSPYEIQLSQALPQSCAASCVGLFRFAPLRFGSAQDLTHQGTYAFDLNLGELNADLAGRRCPATPHAPFEQEEPCVLC